MFAETFTLKAGYGRKSMKMSRGINLHFRSGKYSNAAESYATEMSAENRAYTIGNILTKAAEFRCQNCQFPRTLCPAGKNLAAGKFCLEDQGLFVACTLARSHWSTRSHRRNSSFTSALQTSQVHP